MNHKARLALSGLPTHEVAARLNHIMVAAELDRVSLASLSSPKPPESKIIQPLAISEQTDEVILVVGEDEEILLHMKALRESKSKKLRFTTASGRRVNIRLRADGTVVVIQ